MGIMAHFLLQQVPTVMADYVGSICGLRVQNVLSIVANASEWLLSADCIHCRLRVFLLWQMLVGHISTASASSFKFCFGFFASTSHVPCGNAAVLLPVVLRMLF
jgi:hypothetical protein